MAKKITSKSVIETQPEIKKLVGLVVIIATDKAKYMVKGKEYTVSAGLAETLINKGFAKLK